MGSKQLSKITIVLALAGSILGPLASSDALAYCLTGVKWPTPPDATVYYNSSGKVTSGQCISSSQMDTAVTSTIGSWRALTHGGSTSAKPNRRDGQNVVGWANLGGGTLGITNYLSYGNPILSCGGNSFYTLFEADVRLAKAYRWTSTQGSCPCAAGSAFYLNAVAQHEYGHVIGLCHVSSPSALMYASFGVCENKSIGSDENSGQNALCY